MGDADDEGRALICPGGASKPLGWDPKESGDFSPIQWQGILSLPCRLLCLGEQHSLQQRAPMAQHFIPLHVSERLRNSVLPHLCAWTEHLGKVRVKHINGGAQHISLKYSICDVNWTNWALLHCSRGTINFIQWRMFIWKIWGQEVSLDCDMKAIKVARAFYFFIYVYAAFPPCSCNSSHVPAPWGAICSLLTRLSPLCTIGCCWVALSSPISQAASYNICTAWLCSKIHLEELG